jgi:predicted MFS family arabinose efflux permease
MAMSYTSVWAATTFGLGPQGVAMLYVVSGIVGAIGNPLIGLYSDRLRLRRPFVVGQLIVCALALLGYTQTRSYEVALFLVAFSGFGVMGLTLTTVGDVARSRGDLPPAAVLRILSTERTAWAMGIIVGPAVAALIVTLTGDDLRPIFVGAAALELLAAGWAWSIAEPSRHGAARPRVGGAWPRGRQVGLALLVVGMIFLALPAQTRNMYMPLYVTQVLGQPFGAVGPAFTLNACTAVLVMPHVGALSGRIGAQRVLYLGIGVGCLYCALQSVAPTYLFTLLLQCLIGITISLWSTGALIYLQALLPDRSGVAGGLYLTVQQLTPVVSGLALGPIAAAYGIGATFATTAALQVLALVLLVAAHRAVARPSPAMAAVG